MGNDGFDLPRSKSAKPPEPRTTVCTADLAGRRVCSLRSARVRGARPVKPGVRCNQRNQMRYVAILLGILLPTTALCDEYKIREKRYYGSESYELQRVETGGASIKLVLELAEPRKKELRIRILDPISESTGREMEKYYEKTLPEDFAAASRSSGDRISPAIDSLSRHFEKAFRSTKAFGEFEKALDGHGLLVLNIEHEKFGIHQGNPWVAEATLVCRAAPNH